LALVAYDLEQLGVGQRGAERRHLCARLTRDMGSALAVGVAVGAREASRAELDELELVLDVGEGLDHGALGEGPTGPAAAGGAVAPGAAVARVDLGAGDQLGGLGHRGS